MKPPPYLREVTKLTVDGRALRKWLDAYDIRQSDLATMTGLSRSYISDIVNGSRAAGEDATDAIWRGLSKLIATSQEKES